MSLTEDRGLAGGAARSRGRSAWVVEEDRTFRYEVRMEEPLLAPENRALLTGGPAPGRRFVVCDEGAPAAWRAGLQRYFERHRIESEILLVPGGEASKSVDELFRVIARLEGFNLDRRNEPVIIVGGGAVMDMASLAASLYRRGVPFIKVPTTLLAWVDASVGVKTAVNFGHRKNLVGSFTPPLLVLLDTSFLASLPDRELSSGLAEILKLGIGCDEQLLWELEALSFDAILEGRFRTEGRELLFRAIDVMLRELESNIFEDGLARAVDLGHTFSQAYEMRSAPGEPLLHGEAVCVDLNLSCVLANRRGLLADDDVARVGALSSELRLPAFVEGVGPEELWLSLVERTRHRGGRQRVPLPCGLGRCVFVDDLTRAEVEHAYSRLAEAHRP